MYNIKYPVAFHPVDMAITRIHEGRIQVCLAQKIKDQDKKVWRFPGGFIDPWDSCSEEAALRESIEETSMKFGNILTQEDFDSYFAKKAPLTKKLNKLIEENGSSEAISAVVKELQEIKISAAQLNYLRKNIKYIGSTKIDDERYRDTDHKVITSFYELHPAADKQSAGEGPFDDIARTKWFFLSDIKDEIMHPSHKPLFEMLFNKYQVERIADEFISQTEGAFKHMEDSIKDFKKHIDDSMQEFEKKFPEFEKKGKEMFDKLNTRMEKIFDGFFN